MKYTSNRPEVAEQLAAFRCVEGTPIEFQFYPSLRTYQATTSAELEQVLQLFEAEAAERIGMNCHPMKMSRATVPGNPPSCLRTGAEHIIGRSSAMIDIDIQGDGTSADAEKVKDQILELFAKELGSREQFTDMFTGRGYHVHVHLDAIPGSKFQDHLVGRLLFALDDIFGTPKVKIDQSTADIMRMISVAGTSKIKNGVASTVHLIKAGTAAFEDLKAFTSFVEAVEGHKRVNKTGRRSSYKKNARLGEFKQDIGLRRTKLDDKVPMQAACDLYLEKKGTNYVCPSCHGGKTKHKAHFSIYSGKSAGGGETFPNGAKCHKDNCVDRPTFTPTRVVQEVKGVDVREAQRILMEDFGLTEEDFHVAADWEEGLVKDKDGSILDSRANTRTIMLNDAGIQPLGYDLFRSRVVCRSKVDLGEGATFIGDWTDSATTNLTAYLSKKYGVELTDGNAHAFIKATSQTEERSFHVVRDYLNSCVRVQDKDMIGGLLVALRVEDTPYNRATLRCTLIGGVARVFRPGCKLDTMLILEGSQGVGKSTAFRNLMPNGDWFKDDLKHLNGQGLAEAKKELCGKWLIEHAELDALTKSEVNSWKAFMTCQSDNLRASYGRIAEDTPRQSFFVGTVNPGAKYLRDETGNRRFWPIRSTATLDNRVDNPWIAQNRDAIWAEVRDAYLAGDKWHLSTELEKAALEEAEERRACDPWEFKLEAHICANPDKDFITLDEAFKVVGKEIVGDQDGRLSDRVTKCFTALKWEYTRRKRIGSGLRVPAFIRPGAKGPEQIEATKEQVDFEAVTEKNTNEQFATYNVETPTKANGKAAPGIIRAPGVG